jgi:hypothetical protein
MPPGVLVTGDVVLDCHLYGGVKTAATSFREPGTQFRTELGGAALTCRVLQAAATTRSIGPRPKPEFAVQLAFDTRNLAAKLSGHLRSYGVWVDRPLRADSDRRVWRIERQFGYGPAKANASDVIRPSHRALDAPPLLTVIDDGAILFRHAQFKRLWPDVRNEGLVLLKMGSPLCRGDLWPELAKSAADRLIVVVNVNDLRREDLRIGRRLSWEQSVDDLLAELRRDRIGQELLQSAHVVVNFQSDGAVLLQNGGRLARLVFDPLRLEGEYHEAYEGSAYGFQTCLIAGLASHVMRHLCADTRSTIDASSSGMSDALTSGIVAGLSTQRLLLEQGHGDVTAAEPGFPFESIGAAASADHGGFVVLDIADTGSSAGWSILTHREFGRADASPLVGLGTLAARYGAGKALSDVSALRRGRLFTVDRREIERLRMLDGLIRSYVDVKVQKKPLCIGVFGPPGAGKSFGVRALAEGVLGRDVPFLEFNLSQFKGPDDLVGALHRVRDAVLGGITPVAFWDEFDSRNYDWLQYLLAPMQDGAFQEGQITHPIGKSIFVFAGGTSETFEQFGVPVPKGQAEQEGSSEVRREHDERYREYNLRKGPDFVSRLHGHLNVLGPNPAGAGDLSYPVRRAILLRGILGLKDEELRIDNGLLYALLMVSKYRHGARSFEKIVQTLAQARVDGRLVRSGLPVDLARDLEDVDEFRRLLDERSQFRSHPDIDTLAAAIHLGFLKGAERSRIEAAVRNEPNLAWTIHPAIERSYNHLSEDLKASNRSAARRIPDHLALINFIVEPLEPGDDSSWKLPLEAAIERHLERLAQAEHLGWWAEQIDAGRTTGPRDDTARRHPLMVEWAKLLRADQDKDRTAMRGLPAVLEVAKYKAVPFRRS